MPPQAPRTIEEARAMGFTVRQTPDGWTAVDERGGVTPTESSSPPPRTIGEARSRGLTVSRTSDGWTAVDERGEDFSLATQPTDSTATVTPDRPDSFASKFFGIPQVRGLAQRKNLPMIGGTVGGIAGGIPGALLGGAVGEGLRQATGSESDRAGLSRALQVASSPALLWMMSPEQRSQAYDSGMGLAKQGGFHGGLEGAGKGVGLVTGKVSKWAMDSALKAGLRLPKLPFSGVGGSTEATGTITNPSSIAAKFPNIDIPQEAINRRIPITSPGLQAVERDMRMARTDVLDTIAEVSRNRPAVSGLLPEGTVAVPTGTTPVPSGGVISVGPSRNLARAPFSQIRSRQGTDVSPRGDVSNIFGGTPSKITPSATADVVEGAGTVRMPMSAAGQTAPTASLIPGRSAMIGIDEVLEPALARQASQRGVVLADEAKVLDDLIANVRNDYADPVDLMVAQRRKDYAQSRAEGLWVEGKGGVKAPSEDRLFRDIASGYKKAIEARIPGIAEKNKGTQTLYAIYFAMREALDKETRSARFTSAGALDNPRFWGKVRTTLRGLSSAFNMTPTALRGSYLALQTMFGEPKLMPSHHQNQSTSTMADIVQ